MRRARLPRWLRPLAAGCLAFAVAAPCAAAVAVRASTCYSGSFTTPMTAPLPKPTGTAAGDVIVMSGYFHLGGSRNVTVTPPAGWTLHAVVDQPTSVSVSGGSRHVTYWRVATAAEPSSYNFGMSSTGGSFSGTGAYCMIAFSGVASAAPVASSASALAPSGDRETVAAVTATMPGAMVLAHAGSTSGAAYAYVSGLSAPTTQYNIPSNASRVSYAVLTQALASAGSVGPVSVILGSVPNDTHVGQLLVLRPPLPDVSLTVSRGAALVASLTVRYTYTLRNVSANYSDAGGFTVSIPLPSGMSYVAASGTGWSCGASAGTVTCTRSGALAAGASAPALALDVAVAANASGAITLTATATSAAGDDTTANNTASDTATVQPVVHHYELSLPSAAATCQSMTAQVTACADASSPCTNPVTTIAGQTATLAASGGSLGATTVAFNASGVASTSYAWATAGTSTASITLGGETSAAQQPRRCCADGVSCAAASSCSLAWSPAAFVVAAAAGGASTTPAALTAATTSPTYWLRAVTTSTTTGACEAALTGTQSVNWAMQCVNPSTCSSGNRLTVNAASSVSMAGLASGATSPTTAVSMTFDASGNAPFTFSYADAGQIAFNVSKPASGTLLTSLAVQTAGFVVKPASLAVSGVRCTTYAAGSCATAAIASPGANPGAADATGTAFIPAGAAFTATVTALDALGSATPNFGRETTPEAVRLDATLVAPAGGAAPALGNPTGLGAWSAGAATGTAFTWSEAGVIRLTPSLVDGDYLGAGAVAGTASGTVGRFTAHHFDVAVTPGCGGFTYAGQPFAATVTAKSAAPATTLQNYTGAGGFARAVTLAPAAALAGTLGGGAVASSAFAAGAAAAAPSFEFTAKETAPATLALRATDSDGASSASGGSEGSTVLRSGRLRLASAYGRADAALALELHAEYWSGTSWLTNAADGCTTLPLSAVAVSNPRGADGLASTGSTAASAVALASGTGTLTLAAPAPAGAALSVDVALNLGAAASDQSCHASHPASAGAARPWLRSRFGGCAGGAWDRDPAATATFGVRTPTASRSVQVRNVP